MDFAKLTACLLSDGWAPVPGKRHVKLRREGVGTLVLPCSTSDHRSALNARAEARRLYRRAGVALPAPLRQG